MTAEAKILHGPPHDSRLRGLMYNIPRILILKPKMDSRSTNVRAPMVFLLCFGPLSVRLNNEPDREVRQ